MREAYLHDADLGPVLDVFQTVNEYRDHPAVRAVLQYLREKSAETDRTGRQVPTGADALDFRAYHSGAADGLEEAFWELQRARLSELEKELEERAETSEG